MKDYDELPDKGENLRTVYVDGIGVARDEDNNVGIVIRPMDEAPFVIQLGGVEDLVSLADYFRRCVEA